MVKASQKLKAVITVNLYGNPAPISYNCLMNSFIPIVADNAEGLGAEHKHHMDHSTQFGHYSCYSFNGNKTLTTGGGGLIIGNNLSKIRQLANIGRDKNGEFQSIGYNYRMNGLSAALGLSQLKRLDEIVAKKRRINEIYRNELDNILTFQQETPNSKSSFWLTACTFPTHINIDKLQKKLLNENIPTRRIFKPLNQLKPYLSDEKFEVAEFIYEHGLCLPIV